MKLAVKVMNMPSSQFEASEHLQRLPKRNENLNKAHYIEVAAKYMPFFQKCAKLAQRSGLVQKKLGPGVQLFFTGTYRHESMCSKNEECQAIRMQRSINHHCCIATLEGMGDPRHKFTGKHEDGENKSPCTAG